MKNVYDIDVNLHNDGEGERPWVARLRDTRPPDRSPVIELREIIRSYKEIHLAHEAAC